MKTVTLPHVELGTEKTSEKTIFINSHVGQYWCDSRPGMNL